MKRLILLSILVSASWLAPVHAQTGNVQDFVIDSFEAEYRLSRDSQGVGRMSVKETIVAVFPGHDQNHGILRAIPETYGDYDLNVSVASVTDQKDRPYPYTTYTENDNLVLRIGDADTFVHGQTVYVIEYQLKNMITFYEDHDEFFWDINGDEWQQPFGMVKASIYIPDELALNLLEQKRCFTGAFGSTSSDCNMDQRVAGDGILVEASAEELGPGENLSVVLGFDSGTFYEDPWPARIRMLLVASGVIPPALILWYAYSRWRRYGRDHPGKGVVIARYSPPDDLNPLSADVVLNEHLRKEAVSAAIIELAVSGYVKIIETKKDKLIGSDSEYELELIKDASDLPRSMTEVVEGIFGSADAEGERIKLKDKANKLHGTMSKLSKDVPKGLAKRDYFFVDPNKARQKWIIRGAVVLALGLLLVAFYWTRFFGIGLAGGGVILMLFAPAMPARAKKGVEAKEHLEGLKDYISLAEKDRIKFLQSPEGVKQYGDPSKPENQIKLFEKLLPYAMLLGLEKDWAKEFEHLYDEPPEWFSTYRSSFTPIILADSLSSFNTSTSTAFSSPQSSGSSGFSGGGFSGGGGGGGGGGGW